jgi:hypothetical protein
MYTDGHGRRENCPTGLKRMTLVPTGLLKPNFRSFDLNSVDYQRIVGRF